tara:strand:- start:822 stop:1094 length:273 start_codon:yes stop_codon:yes gene_type:complete
MLGDNRNAAPSTERNRPPPADPPALADAPAKPREKHAPDDGRAMAGSSGATTAGARATRATADVSRHAVCLLDAYAIAAAARVRRAKWIS